MNNTSLFDGLTPISTYSRAQAIDDGVLVDVSETASEAGIKYPTALTRAAYDKYVKIPKGVRLQDERGRLWDVVSMLRFAIMLQKKAAQYGASLDLSLIWFKLHVRNSNRQGTPPLVTLKAICSPGDTPDPVITIMMPDED